MAEQTGAIPRIDIGYKWKGWDPEAALQKIEETKDRAVKKDLIRQLKSEIVDRSREIMSIAEDALQKFPELDFQDDDSEPNARKDISQGLASVMSTLERYQNDTDSLLAMRFDPQAVAKELIGDDWPDWLKDETPEFSRYGFALQIKLSRRAAEACYMGNGYYLGVKDIRVGWRKISVPIFIRRSEADQSYEERELSSKSNTSAHELQHAFFDILHDVLFKQPRGQNFDEFRSELDKVLKQVIRKRTSSEEKHSLIRRTILSHSSRKVADEILANVTGGRFDKVPHEDIKPYLTRIYVNDFEHYAGMMYMRYLDQYNEEYRTDDFRKAAKEFLSGQFEKGIDAVYELKQAGYSNFAIAGLLTLVPVRMWPSLVRRLKEAEN